MPSKQTNYRRLTQRCPHCETQAVVADSRPVTRTTRELYFACSNLHCGFTWKSQLAIVAEISPSSVPHPEVRLPKVATRRHAGKIIADNDNQAGDRLFAAGS